MSASATAVAQPQSTVSPDAAGAYFRDLQNRVCAAFEAFEPAARFARTPWTRPPEHRLKGGGEMRLMRGEAFEKVGVNFSHVWGEFSEQARKQISGAEASGGRFVACGISLVSHMTNPFVPTVHLNLRFLKTDKAWFGGGADLTPAFPFAEDTQEFHAALKRACDSYRPDAHAEYKAWCDRYFFLPHRQEPRGVGGIFFDDLNSGDQEADFAFIRAVGEAFLDIYPRIMRRRLNTPYGDAEREKLFTKRGRYVEFNLVYDRGTKFGFATDANPEAYLMSLPPIVKW